MATPAVTQSKNFSGQPQDFGAMLEKQGTTLGSFAQMILENLIITHDGSSLDRSLPPKRGRYRVV